jgi:hypothetical protein
LSVEFSMPAWVEEAVRHGFLSQTEARVVAERIAGADAPAAAPEQGGLDADARAVHWSRALPKLRVYILIAHVETFGGTAVLLNAFEQARRSALRPLTPLEAEAFQHEVLRRQPPRRRPGWTEAVRSAAAKVVRYLPFDPLAVNHSQKSGDNVR